MGSLFLAAPRAKAFESPLQSLVDLTQKIVNADKDASNQLSNQLNGEFSSNQSDQNTNQNSDSKKNKDKEKKLEVPQPVDDPKKIEEAVDFASQATGVRKEFLMGMLTVESNLGRNPGKCTYQQVEDGANLAHSKGQLSGQAWNTFLQRRDTIQDLAKSLGYDPDKLKVSCNPSGVYAGTGGAMGIPQFMPDIWMAYKDRISQIVGKDNPDPWDIKDGVVAMALLVSDTPGVTAHDPAAERNAAKMYLSGTTSPRYDWYANQIFYWAANYKNLLG